MDPHPLFGAFADPALVGRVHLGEDRCDVGLVIAGVGYVQRRLDGDAEIQAVEPPHPSAVYRAAILQRQLGDHRRGHRRPPEERHRHTLIVFLVGQQSQQPAPLQRGARQHGAEHALRHQPAVIAAHADQQLVDIGIVRPAEDHIDIHAERVAEERQQLPIAQMAGKNDVRPRLEIERQGVLDADDLEAFALDRNGLAAFGRGHQLAEPAFGDAVEEILLPELAQMRILKAGAAEIAPHAAYDGAPLGVAFLREDHCQIGRCTPGDGDVRADHPAEPAAQRGGRAHRKQPDQEDEHVRARPLEPISQPPPKGRSRRHQTGPSRMAATPPG